MSLQILNRCYISSYDADVWQKAILKLVSFDDLHKLGGVNRLLRAWALEETKLRLARLTKKVFQTCPDYFFVQASILQRIKQTVCKILSPKAFSFQEKRLHAFVEASTPKNHPMPLVFEPAFYIAFLATFDYAYLRQYIKQDALFFSKVLNRSMEQYGANDFFKYSWVYQASISHFISAMAHYLNFSLEEEVESRLALVLKYTLDWLCEKKEFEASFLLPVKDYVYVKLLWEDSFTSPEKRYIIKKLASVNGFALRLHEYAHKFKPEIYGFIYSYLQNYACRLIKKSCKSSQFNYRQRCVLIGETRRVFKILFTYFERVPKQ